MIKSCIMNPTVKVGNKNVESKLFKDLLSLTNNNRKLTNYIWGLEKALRYNNMILNAKKDENGETTIEALDKLFDLKTILKGNTSLIVEKKKFGIIDENNNPIVYKHPGELANKAIDINNTNPDLVADIHKVSDGYIMSLDNKNESNMDSPSKLVFKHTLNNKLLSIVRRLGFDVKEDDKLTYAGIFDPTNAEYTAEGLKTVIKISKGEIGEEAFPEEFSHMIIAGLRKEPLVMRLMNTLNEEVIKEVLGNDYESYYNLYKGDINILKEETAGKLLHNHIIHSEKISNNLISRLWQWVKNKFKSLFVSDINDAINKANEGFADLASKVMDESILPFVSIEEIKNSPILYKINSELNKMEKLANDSLEVASKRLKIIQARNKNKGYDIKDMKAIKNLQSLIESKKYTKGCIMFLSDSLNQIETINGELNKLLSRDTRASSNLNKIRRIAFVLRIIKEFADGYEPIIKQFKTIKSMQKNGEVDITEEEADMISSKASEIFDIINDINSNYEKLRFDIVYNFLKIYWGEDKIIKIGKDKGQELTLEMLLKAASKDINGIDRWVSSLSDASDPLLSLIDKVVKISKNNRDEILENFIINIRAEHNKLLKAGYTPDFIFEKDANGKPTGRLISDYDFERFYKERDEYKKSLEKENKNYYYIKLKLEIWDRNHLTYEIIDKEAELKVLVPIYKKDTLSKLSKEERDYYDIMKKTKAVLDSYLPANYTNLYNAIQIRNSLTETITDGSKSIKESAKLILENIKDNFINRVDDSEFGDRSNTLLDFSGEPVKKLPIHYVVPLEDMSRLSMDFTSSMIAYAGMAVNYYEMNKIIDALELTKDLVNDREVKQFSGNNKLTEKFKVLSKEFNKDYLKKGSESNIGSRLEDYYDAAVYERMKKDQGSFNVFDTEVSTSKTFDSIKYYTAILGLGVNLFSGISNLTAGNLQLIIEAAGGEYFNFKDWIAAKFKYWGLLPAYLGELNSTNKTNKLALLMDKFDSMEEFYNNLKRQGKFKGPLARILGSLNIFFLNTIGEHYLHNNTMLAMLNAYKVKDGENEISLYDAFYVEKIKDDKGNVISAKLALKNGITKLNGEPLKTSDLKELKLHIGKVNQSLNGAFSEDDKGAIHRGALGRLAMQYRQWMPAHYNRRFASTYYDARLDKWREGYYRTLYRFSLNLIRDLVRMKFELITNYNNLEQHEKANLKRALSEISIYITLSILISAMGPEKDKKGVWASRMIIYNLKRMKLETGASMPSPDFIGNIWTLMQSPAAAVRTINNITDLLEFQNMFVEIQSGRYKGMSRYERDLIELIPLYGNINKVFDVTDEDYMFQIFK